MSARRLDPARRASLTRLAEGDTYGTLLVLIIVAYVLMAVVEDSKWARTITGICFGGTLLLALHTSHVRGRIIQIAAVVVGVSWSSWSAALAATDHEPFRGATHVTIILIMAAPGVILYRIFRHPVINVETILGAIDAYLLLGISFAAVYLMLDDIDPHFFAQGAASGVKYLYFSFVVITTLGLRRPHAADRHRARDREPRGAARPDLPRHRGRGAGGEHGPRRAAARAASRGAVRDPAQDLASSTTRTTSRPTSGALARADAELELGAPGRRDLDDVAGPRRVDHLAAADVEPDVVEVGVEDDDVAGLQLVPADLREAAWPASPSSGPCSRRRHAHAAFVSPEQSNVFGPAVGEHVRLAELGPGERDRGRARDDGGGGVRRR